MTASAEVKQILQRHDSDIVELRGDIADVKADVGAVKSSVATLDNRITSSTQAILERIDRKEERHGGEVKEDIGTLKNEHRNEMARVERITAERTSGLEKKVAALDAEVAKRGRTHWPTVLTGCALMLSIVIAVATWIKQYVDGEVEKRDLTIAHSRELADKDFKHNDEIRELLRKRIEDGIAAVASEVKVNDKRLTILEGETTSLAKDSGTRAELAAARLDALTRWFAYLFELQTGKQFPSPIDQQRGPKASDLTAPQFENRR